MNAFDRTDACDPGSRFLSVFQAHSNYARFYVKPRVVFSKIKQASYSTTVDKVTRVEKPFVYGRGLVKDKEAAAFFDFYYLVRKIKDDFYDLRLFMIPRAKTRARKVFFRKKKRSRPSGGKMRNAPS